MDGLAYAKTNTASASTSAPRGRDATPTAARAGNGWANYCSITALNTAKLDKSVK